MFLLVTFLADVLSDLFIEIYQFILLICIVVHFSSDLGTLVPLDLSFPLVVLGGC